jgi:AbiJ N-terminal domain 4
MSFSDRLGITNPKTILQAESIDADLRNGLWQACIENYVHYYERQSEYSSVMKRIFVDFLKIPSDRLSYDQFACIDYLRKWFYGADWWQVYNFTEFLFGLPESAAFIKRVSFFLEREKSAYRVVNKQLVPISDPIEVRSVIDAASIRGPYVGAQQHLQTAISLFSKKPEPDYRNSIKEAISAVEAIARVITENPKATLGEALKKIEEKMTIHPALREAMSRLYGYTSDEGGIRHAMLEQSNIDEAEAKFMIVTCSAFVNFCVQRAGS